MRESRQSAGAPNRAPSIEIRVGMDKPWTHYFEVVMSVSGAGPGDLDFVMPVWTPGSYLVREFARNVEGFSADDGSGNPLNWAKVNKNTWRVRSKGDKVAVHYHVYAFEPSVRTSFLDDSHGFINGASVFMYLDHWLGIPYRVQIVPNASWSQISTGLEPAAGDQNTFLAPDFDTLVDSPIEVGNQTVLGFDAEGVPHYVSIYGEGNYDPEKLVADIRRIVLAAAKIIGEVPYKHYTFLIHLLAEGGGGLEHANSAAIVASRWAFQPEENYLKFLDLVSHEFFHLWNVKRIHPAEFDLFDYTRENYTRMLWVSEGFTDYYDSLTLRRAGLLSPEQYLDHIAKTIQDYRETPGRLVESAAEASFDAWIKFYRQDAHSPNSSISYYTKGGLIALVLDLEMRRLSGNSRSLDDVMRLLYGRFYKERKRGFTEEEFRNICEEVAGAPLDGIFDGYVYGTKEVDFEGYLGHAGLKLAQPGKEGKERPTAYLGVSVKPADGRIVISAVQRETPAYCYGLSVNDEIIAVDGYRASLDTLQARIEEKAPGSKSEILVSRDGRLRTIPLVLGQKKTGQYKIEKAAEATPEQQKLRESWLQ